MNNDRYQISGLRAEIKLHREQTRRIRDGIRAARAAKDRMAAFRAQLALNERLRMIRDRELLIKEIKERQP